MEQCPSPVANAQLGELGIAIAKGNA
jgi:hypothetical protein